MPRIVSCRREHLEAVIELLHDAGLSSEGVQEHPRHYWVAQAGAEVVGAVGLEPHGEAALLRSLVVREDRRRGGLGAALVRRALKEGRRLGTRQIVLVTVGAAEFFRRYGFEPVDIERVPEKVRESTGFRVSEPGRGVCMRINF